MDLGGQLSLFLFLEIVEIHNASHDGGFLAAAVKKLVAAEGKSKPSKKRPQKELKVNPEALRNLENDKKLAGESNLQSLNLRSNSENLMRFGTTYGFNS